MKSRLLRGKIRKEGGAAETRDNHLECDPDWDDCQKRQAREKVRRLNEAVKAAQSQGKPGLTRGLLREIADLEMRLHRLIDFREPIPPGPSATEDQIQSSQQFLGVTLPDPYRTNSENR